MPDKVMAKALAPEIAGNAVAPGMIDLGEKSAATSCEKWRRTPMQRNGTGEEMHGPCAFLRDRAAVHYRAGSRRGWGP